MNGSARCQLPASRMNACWSSPATRPTSNIRSPRFIRSRSIAATSMPWPNRKFAGVASPCSQTCWSCHMSGRSRQRSRSSESSSMSPRPMRWRFSRLPTTLSKYWQSGSKSTLSPLAVRLCCVARKYASAFSRQYSVDVAVHSQRANYVVRRPDQVVPAQRHEPLVLLACHRRRFVQICPEPRAVELAYDLGAGELLFVGVDLVAAGQPEDAERGPPFAHPHAVADDLAQVAVERVVTREVSDVFSVHGRPPRAGAATAPSDRPPCPPRCAAFVHVADTAPLPDMETPGPFLIRSRAACSSGEPSQGTGPAAAPAVTLAGWPTIRGRRPPRTRSPAAAR